MFGAHDVAVAYLLAMQVLAGCSSTGLIADAQEIEGASGFVLALYSLPGAELKGFRFTQEQVEEADGAAYWHLETGVEPSRTNGWLVFIDPFHLDVEGWIRSWNEAYAPLPLYGGLASGAVPEPLTQVYLTAMCSRTAAWRFRSAATWR